MNNSNILPVLVLVRGIPGSGKSFLAKELAKEFDHDSYISLDPDQTDYESQAYKDHVIQQRKEGVDEILHPYRFLRAKAYKAIENHQIIIWNQPFTDLQILRNVTNRLEEHAHENQTKLPILIVEVEIPEKEAWKRLEIRKAAGGHGPEEERFKKFVSDYSTAAEAGYQTITVDGKENPTIYTKEISEKIKFLSNN